MCGIAGEIRFDGQPARRETASRMAEVIRHRGPDDAGDFAEGPVAFAHRRLSIIDLASGHQPMATERTVIVFNGEIYNYIELRNELRARGHSFETASDTEVILRLYEEYGPDCIARLNGMFALALFDRQHDQVLLARDHFGVKPLYVHATPERLLFASEIKALLAAPGVRSAADLEGVQEYLTFQYVLGARTMFQGITKVLPGEYHLLGLSSGAHRSVRYWEPRFQTDHSHTERYFVEQIQWLVADAVRLQMRSDVPVGTYLSGGLDSSLVTALAARNGSGPLQTFTGRFDEGPEFDETGYARLVAESCGAAMQIVTPTEADFVDLLPRLVYHMDEPVAGPGLFPQYMVSREASRHVKVMLGGQGGDEIFGGYARYLVAYFEQAIKGAIEETSEDAEHIVTLASIVPNLPALRQYLPMMQQFWRAGLFEEMDRRYFRLVDRSGGALSLLSNDFRNCYPQDAIFQRFQAVFNHPETTSYYNKMTHYDLVTNLPALLQVEDRVTMASSLESRVPLLDYRLADLVASMPPGMKFKGGELKYVLKRAIGTLLPEPILSRKDKMGFPVPLHLWARGRSRDFFADVLLSSRCRERGLFDPVEVEKLMAYEGAFGRRLWGLLNLELWFRTFIDAPSN
jgi:asparagine synthase (glutamine-hydrolysing)